MRAVQISVRAQDFQNHRTAGYGCDWIDHLLKDLSSPVVDRFQEALWAYTADTERELQKLHRRDKRRKSWWARLPKPDRISAELRRLHLVQMERRRTVLEERRRILRHIGDACAWIVLRADPAAIQALYASDRTHFLAADGLGVLGPRSVMRLAHASGEFIVLNTDLTRCLGIGDLVAVPADGVWQRPLVFEVKTRPEGEDNFSTLLVGARPAHPGEAWILDRFSRATGFEIQDPVPLREREARQADEIQRGAKLIRERWDRIKYILQASCEDHWRTVESVLTRAQQAGAACETAEDGVVYAASRNAPGDDDSVLMEQMLQKVIKSGVHIPDHNCFSSIELRHEEALSSVVLPFLLWNVPQPHRVALLNSELEFFSFVRKTVWREAFERHGLEWLEEHGWWRLSRAERHMVFDPVRVAKFMFDAASSAFSPNALAKAVAQAMDAEAP